MSRAATSRSLSPFELRLERRLDVPRWLPLATTIGAVAVALVIGGLDHRARRRRPDPRLRAHRAMAAFGDIGVLSDTLVDGHAAHPHRARLRAGLPDAALEHRRRGPAADGRLGRGGDRPGCRSCRPTPRAPLHRPLMLVAGFVMGALWGFIPGVLKARLGVNEIIVTLMLNYIAALWITFWVFGPWSEGGFQQSAPVPARGLAAASGRLRGAGQGLLRPDRPSWPRPRAGRDRRSSGSSSSAAAGATRSGSSATRRRPRATQASTSARTTILVFMLSGGLAGLAGMSEVAGTIHRLQQGISPGYGFTAIIVAYIAKFNPFGVVIASIFFAALILAGREIQPAGVPGHDPGHHPLLRSSAATSCCATACASCAASGSDHGPHHHHLRRAWRPARCCSSRRSARSSPSAPAS